MDTSDTQAYVRSRMYEPQYGILAATENEALAKSPKWAPSPSQTARAFALKQLPTRRGAGTAWGSMTSINPPRSSRPGWMLCGRLSEAVAVAA